MNFPFQCVLVPVGLSALVVGAWQAQGWGGVALVGGGLVMWGLLHVTRLMTVLKRASDRPKGYVDSAVMLNAKLRPGVNLLHVMVLTRSLGELQSTDVASAEVFRWADNGGSEVVCTFANGRLTHWVLQRPPTAATAGPPLSTPGA
jgi:hypothetical protein